MGRKETGDIITTVPYKGNLKSLNEVFVPSQGKKLKAKVERLTSLKNSKVVK